MNSHNQNLVIYQKSITPYRGGINQLAFHSGNWEFTYIYTVELINAHLWIIELRTDPILERKSDQSASEWVNGQ